MKSRQKPKTGLVYLGTEWYQVRPRGKFCKRTHAAWTHTLAHTHVAHSVSASALENMTGLEIVSDSGVCRTEERPDSALSVSYVLRPCHSIREEELC